MPTGYSPDQVPEPETTEMPCEICGEPDRCDELVHAEVDDLEGATSHDPETGICKSCGHYHPDDPDYPEEAWF